MKARTGLLLLLLTAACGGDEPESAPTGDVLAPPDPSEGVQFAMEVTAIQISSLGSCEIVESNDGLLDEDIDP